MSHLSNPQTQRTLKFFTTVACVGVGTVAVFFSDYDHVEGFEGKEHVFSGIQRDARDFIDKNVWGIDPSAVRNQDQALAKAAAASSRSEGSKGR